MIILAKNLFFILVLIGFIFSAYLTYVHYYSYNPYFCGGGKNCDKVLTSKYSEVFNLPVSLFGAFYFLTLIIIWFFQKKFLAIKIFKIFFKFLIFSGVLIALVSIYLQLIVIKSICIYCLIIDFILLILPFFLMGKYLKKITKILFLKII